MAKDSRNPLGAPERDGDRSAVTDKLLSAKFLGGVVVVGLALWFILINNGESRVHFWLVWVTAKLWMTLAGTFAAGLLAGYLLKHRTTVRARNRKG